MSDKTIDQLIRENILPRAQNMAFLSLAAAGVDLEEGSAMGAKDIYDKLKQIEACDAFLEEMGEGYQLKSSAPFPTGVFDSRYELSSLKDKMFDRIRRGAVRFANHSIKIGYITDGSCYNGYGYFGDFEGALRFQEAYKKFMIEVEGYPAEYFEGSEGGTYGRTLNTLKILCDSVGDKRWFGWASNVFRTVFRYERFIRED